MLKLILRQRFLTFRPTKQGLAVMKALKYLTCILLLRTQSLVALYYQSQNLLTDGIINVIYFYHLKARNYIEQKKWY